MGGARLLILVGLTFTVIAPVSAGTITSQGNIYDLNATTDIYSLVYGGPTIGSHGVATFVDQAPFSYTVTRQGSGFAAGDTISAGEQSVALQGGLNLDVHALDLTVDSQQATLATTPLTNAFGASLDGVTVHGVSGSLAYTLLAAGHAVYSGTFIFRSEDSSLTMGIATANNGVISVFLCGGSGGVFQTEPDASGADLEVLDSNFDTQQGIDAATNGLGIELAFGAPDPAAAVSEPAMLPLFALLTGITYKRRRRA
jgi:hypothetical protein